MANKARTKPSARLARAKKERGEIVAARVKEIAKSKRKGSRGRGYSREDLEALREPADPPPSEPPPPVPGGTEAVTKGGRFNR